MVTILPRQDAGDGRQEAGGEERERRKQGVFRVGPRLCVASSLLPSRRRYVCFSILVSVLLCLFCFFKMGVDGKEKWGPLPHGSAGDCWVETRIWVDQAGNQQLP